MNAGSSYACRHLLPRGPMLRTTVTATLIVAILTSCTAWKPETMAPDRYIRMHDPEAVWVQLHDGSTMNIGRPRVVGDSLRGIVAGGYRNVALKDVTQFRAEEPSKNRTAIAVTAAVLAAAGLVYLATHSDHTQ